MVHFHLPYATVPYTCLALQAVFEWSDKNVSENYEKGYALLYAKTCITRGRLVIVVCLSEMVLQLNVSKIL